MKEFQTIGCFGAGNVASHLVPALKKAGLRVEWIWSRSAGSARRLASRVKSRALHGVVAEIPKTDLVLLCIPDHALHDLRDFLPRVEMPVVHTSGSLDDRDVQVLSSTTGCFYPLQTFTSGHRVVLKKTPFCIGSSDPVLETALAILAGKLTEKVIRTTYEQRLALHVSAVFACNFTNYFYRIASVLMEEARLPFSLLHPLILETAHKAVKLDPGRIQTGPAARRDREAIDKHLLWLSRHPDLAVLYQKITAEIIAKQCGDE